MPSASLLATIVALGATSAVHAADPAKGSLAMGSVINLDAATHVDGLVVRAAPAPAPASPPDPDRAGIAWSKAGTIDGRLLSTVAAPTAIDPTAGSPLAVAFDSDGNLLLAYRTVSGDAYDPLHAASIDEHGDTIDSWDLGTVFNEDHAAADFVGDDETVVALGGAHSSVDVSLWSQTAMLHSRSLDPIAGIGIVVGLQVAVHDPNNILVGWDHFAPCGSSVKNDSVVARLDGDLALVNGTPRVFSSGGCGATGKRLQFLEGPSDVGALAIFADHSAKRFATGQPPPSQLDFRLAIAKGETIAAVAMDGKGRLMVVTRSTAAHKPVRLYVQGYGRDGKSRTKKITVDGDVGAAGFAPDVAAAIADDGAAWIAFTRDAGGRSGLFVRQLTVHLP